MVPALLAMKAAMDAVLAEAFQRDENFGNTLKEAFEQFINQRQNKCASNFSLEPPGAPLAVPHQSQAAGRCCSWSQYFPGERC